MIRRLLFILALFWALTSCGWCKDYPITIMADHPSSVYVRTQEPASKFKFLSASVPTVFYLEPGKRVDIRAVGSDGFFTFWSGEMQGAVGPSSLSLHLEKKIAWERVAGLSSLLLLLSAGAFLLIRYRAKLQLELVHKRMVAAESRIGIPARIAGYTIVSLLGEGAMASVYHGQDSYGRDFAIKVPKEVDKRFSRECVIATTLESAHIVRAFDFYAENSGDRPAYMALEMLTGQTLADRLAKGNPLPLKEVNALVLQLLEGLEVAHNSSILHRDLKPDNIFLDTSRGGEVLKILDFGVARADDALLLTRTDTMLGTPVYASPEQNLAQELDSRSDLYAVGLIIFEMLTGRRAWQASSRTHLMKLQEEGFKATIGQYRSDCPKHWESLVYDLLQTDRALRPENAAEVRKRWLNE